MLNKFKFAQNFPQKFQNPKKISKNSKIPNEFKFAQKFKKFTFFRNFKHFQISKAFLKRHLSYLQICRISVFQNHLFTQKAKKFQIFYSHSQTLTRL